MGVATLKNDELKIVLDGLNIKTAKLNMVVSDMLEAVDVETEDNLPQMVYGEKTSVKALVEGVIKEYRPLAQSKGLSIGFTDADENDPYYIRAMPITMHRVISIVLDNAIRYTKVGSISIKLKKTGSQVVLSIKDTGIGIPPEDKDRVFERFERGSNAIQAHTDGSGIALYIAKKIISRHKDGKIEVSSALGKGTTVTISVREYK